MEKKYVVPANCKKKKKSFLTDNPYMHMMSHTLSCLLKYSNNTSD